MKKRKQNQPAAPPLAVQVIPADFTPSQDQIDALASRMMPEIKRFFADEQIQREFTAWQAKQDIGK